MCDHRCSETMFSVETEDDADAAAPPGTRELVVAVTMLLVVVLVGGGWSLGFQLGNAHNGLLATSFTAVGLYILRMRPGHREALLFVAVGLVHAVMFFGRQYGSYDESLPGAAWLGWLGVWPLPLALALVGWTLMAFPDGRLASPRWRLAVAGMFAVAFGLSLVSALWPVDYERTALLVPHPLDVPGASGAKQFWAYGRGSFLAFQVLWTAAIVARIRRARGDEALQMRWLVYAAVVNMVLLVAGLAVAGSPVPGLLASPLLPVAAGVAVLKYRLYEIDPVINKTIVISAMVLVITAGYLAVVLGVGAFVPAGRGVLWLLTTALVAVVAEPLRQRAQRLADRFVYGHRTTPYEALSELTANIDGAPHDLLEGIAATVANAVGAREVVVWVGDAEKLVPAAAWPCNVAHAAHALPEICRRGWHVRPLAHQGRVLGALAVRKPVDESLTTVEGRLLSDLGAQTALVVVQQRQAEQLQAAARRIVTAQDVARRRIERDLHDGAQQRLVTLGLELGAVVERATADPALAARVAAARTQLLDATAELRELARGLHPTVLTEQGLSAALEALADRSSIPVTLSVVSGGRLPREVEATTYFLVSEALTNASRHSAARGVKVCVRRVDAGLQVEVVDDGRGGATCGEGGGLEGIEDRLAALGARLQLDSPVGGGTRIATVLPCV